MKKYKVMQIVGTMNRGGAETFLMNAFRNIDREKIEFIFLCYGNAKFDYEDEIISLGGKIVRIPDIKESGIIVHIKNLNKSIIDNKITAIHTHTYYNSIFSLIVAKICGIKIRIVHSHTTKSETNPTIIKHAYFLISKIGIDIFANKFVACGNAAGESLFMPWRKFKIIDNGIDIAAFTYNKNIRNAVREELNIDTKTTVLMHAGRLVEVKNHKFLIEIFAEYKKINSNSQLILVGDGPLRLGIEKRIHKLNLSDSVKLLGLRSDIYRIYSAADVFILPSLFEGLPLVLIEAQVNGMKCIVSDTVDKNVKITDSVEFKSLLITPIKWAKCIEEINKKRTDYLNIFKNSQYDIKYNIKNIENIYEGF